MVTTSKVTVTAFILSAFFIFFSITSCSANKDPDTYTSTRTELEALLKSKELDNKSRYAIINQTATMMLKKKEYNSLTLFLTDWVEDHPEDPYNAYWLLMTAQTYLENDAEPVASYYFERIIKNYPDLLIKNTSVHLLSLKNLIRISSSSENRIAYFNQLITQFPNDVSTTEIYYLLALEYEKQGEWKQALKTYNLFLNRSDAPNIQIQGKPNAYLNARQLIDFSNSSKDWTFKTLDELTTAIKQAITRYDYKALDSYKSKVNFFAMSWRQEETDANSQSSFSMHSYMRGNRIYFEDKLDSSSGPTEAYLRTWGWNRTHVNVWYLYFRKVNFPSDMTVHGQWEWAGIYFGEKL